MSTLKREWLTGPALVIGAIAAGQLVAVIWGDAHSGFPWVPWSVQLGLAGVFGCTTALAAVGIILVYRSTRIINFSQAGFGLGATMLYLLLRSAWHWSFWLALPFAIAVAAFIGLVFELFVVRRFANAPRLVLTVSTIALAQAFAGLTLVMPRVWGYEKIPNDPTNGLAGLPAEPPRTPFDRWTFDWYPLKFTGAHVATVVATVVVMAALAAFFRYTSIGIAVRGASENSSRAQLLGISTHNLSTIVWVVAAVLSAVAALLYAMFLGQSVLSIMGQSIRSSGGGGLGEAIGISVLLRALTAAVIARMEKITLAVMAALAISIFEQSVFWSVRQSAMVDAVLLGVIIVALLAQRARFARVDETATSTWASTEEIRGIPHELASLPQVRSGVRRTLWVLAAAILVYPWVMSPSQTNLGALYSIFGIVGISLVVLTGWGGQISLGQFGFVCVGAVIGGSATSRLHLPFLIALVLGTVVSAVVAAGVGLPALRIKGLFLAVTTLAFAVACSTVLLNPTYFDWLLPHALHRPKLLWFDANTDERTYYYLCAFFLGCAIFVVQGLRRSRTGRLLIAMRDNERTAQSHGINLVRSRLTAFAISGGLAGFAGVLYAFHQSTVSAQAFGPEQSIQMFLMAVLGGLGSVYAVLVGAIYLASVTILIHDAWLQLLASSFGVLGILLFFPAGLGALIFRVRDGWLRRIALRNRIFVPSLLGDRLLRGEEARVPIAERLDELEEVPFVYRLESNIGEAGSSQLTKLWRY